MTPWEGWHHRVFMEKAVPDKKQEPIPTSEPLTYYQAVLLMLITLAVFDEIADWIPWVWAAFMFVMGAAVSYINRTRERANGKN